MSLIPRWTPGMLANETVQVTYNLMLSFSAMYGPELRITYTRINYPDVYEKVPVMPDFPEGQQALIEFLAKRFNTLIQEQKVMVYRGVLLFSSSLIKKEI